MFTEEQQILWEAGISIGKFKTTNTQENGKEVPVEISVRLTDHTFVKRSGENSARHGDIPYSIILGAVESGFTKLKTRIKNEKFMISFKWPKGADFWNIAICIRDGNKIQVITLIADPKNKSTDGKFRDTIKVRTKVF